MAVEDGDVRSDSRTNFTFSSDAESVSDELAALASITDGAVRFDTFTKQLYATDASIYAVTPLGVVFPKSGEDVSRVVSHCWEHDIPVLPRGGGTSLAGQAVNEAVVLDCSKHLTGIESIDATDATCTAQPGITLGDLNAALAPEGLKFAPDPAWGEKSVLGGAIGNNSTGSHSLAYGKTDEYIESCEVVFADGSMTTLGWCTPEEIRNRADEDGTLESRLYAFVDQLLSEEAEAVREAYPELHRNVSGYNLNRLVLEAESGQVNVARILAGSEGTLGIVTEATVSLEPIPPTTGVALLLYDDLIAAMQDIEPVLAHGPSAIEVVDDVLLDLAKETEEFGTLARSLPGDPRAFLLVEFYADSTDEAATLVADVIDDRVDAGTTAHPPRASDGLEAIDEATQQQFWKLRKSGLPILLGRTTDEKHVAFIEDTAVPPENLPEFVRDVQDILDAHDTFASIYAHAGPGCLHIRPLIETKSADGVVMMESIADDITDLIVEYGGSVSGEHGDGRARTQWNRKLYGDAIMELFRELKTACDPKWLLNPGQVCGDISMTEHLRFGSEYSYTPSFNPQLEWDTEQGMQGMVELCHGCGGCRGPQETTGGVMCPTYRASREEITATRGRANLLRQAMSGELPLEAHEDIEFMNEVLDLCIGCKGCARDCPSEVDLAKLKAEVSYAAHQHHGTDRRTNLFANIHRIGKLGGTFAPLSNIVQSLPGSGLIAEKVMGIARERSLPVFHRESLLDWMDTRTPGLSSSEAEQEILLLPDTFTNYHEPAIGKAAVRVLESSGVAVTTPDSFLPTGRAAYSVGRLDLAKSRAEHVMAKLSEPIAAGTPIVVIEPTDAVMLQSDYADLLGQAVAEPIATNTFGIMEFIDRFELPIPVEESGRSLTYHGHCHQKATRRDGHAPAVLERLGWDVDILDSGCCGMAGSFGYEAEHYSMSKAIARILTGQIDESSGDVVVAPGGSCRTQLKDELDYGATHPIRLIDQALA